MKKGFTLIEILIAVTIIGLLTSVVTVTAVKSQSRSRDARRKADIGIIESAISVYYAQNKAYPTTNKNNNGVTDIYGFIPVGPSAAKDDWITGLSPNYLVSIPRDPINNASSLAQVSSLYFWERGGDYAYIYRSSPEVGVASTGTWYALAAKLENGDDRESVKNTCQKWILDSNPLYNTGCGANPYNWYQSMYVKMQK